MEIIQTDPFGERAKIICYPYEPGIEMLHGFNSDQSM
jgi:hypothetical protein